MLKDLLRETENRMDKTIEALESDLRAVRTGRASPSLLERVMVDYYGMATPLLQLATISAPEPQLLMVRPFDPSSLGAIEKAIQQADLGLNPSNDGRIIRIPVPRLTEERRRELVKVVRRRAEEAKVALRNIRRDAIDDLRSFQDEKLISEDEAKRGQDDVQTMLNRYIEKVDALTARKEEDIMEI